jgi:predicted transport protein
MTDEARTIFEALRVRIRGIDSEIMEMAEAKSVSYHDPHFFVEILPRARKVTLLLAMNFDEVDDPSGITQDATEKKFIVHARYEGGVSVNVSSTDMIDSVMPLIRQAYAASNE